MLLPTMYCKKCDDYFYNESDTKNIRKEKMCVNCSKEKHLKSLKKNK